MGDISEIRGLLTVGVFITITALLIGWIPSEFLVVGEDKTRQVTVPTYFESIDLLYFAETKSVALNQTDPWHWEPYGAYEYDFELGGHFFASIDDDSDSPHQFGMVHYWYWWIFPTNFHEMNFRNTDGEERGEQITDTELDSDYTEGNVRYVAYCDHVQIITFFGFNETAYSLPSDAWDAHELAVLWAIEFDQVNTSVNAWTIISMILFFEIPTVHWVINILLKVPMWIAFAYLCFIFILRTVGAIFGGGGA